MSKEKKCDLPKGLPCKVRNHLEDRIRVSASLETDAEGNISVAIDVRDAEAVKCSKCGEEHNAFEIARMVMLQGSAQTEKRHALEDKLTDALMSVPRSVQLYGLLSRAAMIAVELDPEPTEGITRNEVFLAAFELLLEAAEEAADTAWREGEWVH